LRNYHPYYEQLLKDPGTAVKASFYVNEEAIRWNNRLFDCAIQNGYNVLVDATFGASLEHFQKQMEKLKSNGFTISINLLCVHPTISYLSNYKRYFESLKAKGSERLVSKEVHDMSVRGLPKNLKALSKTMSHLINKIAAFTREDLIIVPYRLPINSIDALVAIIDREHNRSLTTNEQNKLAQSVQSISEEIKLYAPKNIAAQFYKDFGQS
jgi:Zeta toxin